MDFTDFTQLLNDDNQKNSENICAFLHNAIEEYQKKNLKQLKLLNKLQINPNTFEDSIDKAVTELARIQVKLGISKLSKHEIILACSNIAKENLSIKQNKTLLQHSLESKQLMRNKITEEITLLENHLRKALVECEEWNISDLTAKLTKKIKDVEKAINNDLVQYPELQNSAFDNMQSDVEEIINLQERIQHLEKQLLQFNNFSHNINEAQAQIVALEKEYKSFDEK